MIINIRPDSLELIFELSKHLEGWIFRGHSDAKWKFKTSLERAVETVWGKEKTTGLTPRLERLILQDFKRRAHHYISQLPEENNHLEWLSLLQHYGAPTRLLDFTYSFYVALFFAIDQAFEDAAVWCVNLKFLTEKIHEKYGINLHFSNLSRKEFVSKVNDVLSTKFNEPFVFAAEPSRIHERLSIQKGVFIIPCSFEDSLVDNFAKAVGCDSYIFNMPQIKSLESENKSDILKELEIFPIFKLIIPKKYHYDIFKDLNKMNIDASTLFPGLEGFSKSLYRRIWETEDLKNHFESEKKRITEEVTRMQAGNTEGNEH